MRTGVIAFFKIEQVVQINPQTRYASASKAVIAVLTKSENTYHATLLQIR